MKHACLALVLCPLLIHTALAPAQERKPTDSPAISHDDWEKLNRQADELDQRVVHHHGRAEYADAIDLAEQALDLRKKALGDDAPDTAYARSAKNLAVLYNLTGRYGEAERLYEQAYRIFEAVLGPDYLDTVESLIDLSNFYTQTGRHQEAVLTAEKALQAQESAPHIGPNHIDTADTLQYVAAIYQSAGRHSDAETCHSRALQIYRERLGDNHLRVARAQNNLANVYRRTGRLDEAEEFYQTALRTLESEPELGRGSKVAILRNLAALCESKEQFNEAESFYNQSLATVEEVLKAYGSNNSSRIRSVQNLARFYQRRNRHQEAEERYLQVLHMIEQSKGPNHLETLPALTNLSILYDGMELRDKALNLGNRSAEVRMRNLRNMLSYFTEAECLAFLTVQNPYDLAGFLGEGSLASRVQLQMKGLVLETAGSRRRLAAYLADDPTGAALLVKRDQLSTGYQEALLKYGEAAETTRKRQKQIDALDKEINILLEEASGNAFNLVPPIVDLDDLQAALTENVRLVQGFRYNHQQEERYAWTVLGPASTQPVFVALGTAEVLDADITQFRKLALGLDDEVQAIPAGKRIQQLRESSHRLYQALIAPVLPHLGEANTLILSPDAQLHFLPFSMLLDGTGEDAQIAAKNFNIRYVSTGRDLLRKAPDSLSQVQKDGLLVTNPAFDRAASAQQLASLAAPDISNIGTALLSGYGEDTKSIHFRPTSGLVALQKSLPQLFETKELDLHLLSGTEAAEVDLKNAVAGQRIVHLATHGFFLKELEVGNDEPGPETKGLEENERRGPVVLQNPMYRSGLALAGANDTLKSWAAYKAGGELPPPNNDGMLLAAEAAALDLSGTDVLFLGACETAVGDALDGEGIMGLRRALAIAGARNTILTLWSVQDQPTVEFTELFYSKYLDGMTAATALAETQKELYTKWLDQYGYAEAVNRAGAFICTSLGPVEPNQAQPDKPSSESKPWWKIW